jgi:hypothetical protein
MNCWQGRHKTAATAMPKRSLDSVATVYALAVMELARIFGETPAPAAMAVRSAARAKEVVGFMMKIN